MPQKSLASFGLAGLSFSGLALSGLETGCGSRSDIEGAFAESAVESPTASAAFDPPPVQPPEVVVAPPEPVRPEPSADEPSADEPLTPPCAGSPSPIEATLDQLLESLVSEAPADRAFVRYLLWAPLTDLECARRPVRAFTTDLPEQTALRRVINGLSTRPEAASPRLVDGLGRTLRIDLRDYGWDRPISVSGRQHRDGWEAIVATSGFAVAWAGGRAERVTSLADTGVPFLLARDFLATAGDPNLYYALVDAPEALPELRSQLGIPADADDAGWRRVDAVGGDGVLAGYEGASATYWQLDLDASPTRPNPLTNVIFSLPNGFPAFFSAVEDGARRATDAPPGTDDEVSSAPCLPCHLDGFSASFGDPSAVEIWSQEATALAGRDRDAFDASLSAAEARRGFGSRSRLIDLVGPLDEPLDLQTLADWLFVDPDVLLLLPSTFLPWAPQREGVDPSLVAESYLTALCLLHGEETHPVDCE